MKRIFLLASGSGSNAEVIIRHFSGSDRVEVAGIATNNPQAGVIERASRLQTPCKVFDRAYFLDREGFLRFIQSQQVDLLVLAGFLWLVPVPVVQAFPGRILNIHPALLPEFGGKGYYGRHVHEAVIAAGKILSGITIHQVNERFDEGAIVFQAACHVSKDDSPDTLATKVHALEHRFFPTVIEKYIYSLA